MRTTLICSLCRTMQGEVYCIPIAEMGDIVMCQHVVESVVRIHQVVEEDSEKEAHLVGAPR